MTAICNYGTAVFLDLAMLVLVIKLATDSAAINKWVRFAALTALFGFVCAGVGEYFAELGVGLLVLTFLGFMLAYTAFVFSFPRRQ